MQEGRMDREKPTRKPKRQNPFASTTNREKTKSKNFMMLKQKAKGKAKRSFKDKQVNCLLFVHLFHKKKVITITLFIFFFYRLLWGIHCWSKRRWVSVKNEKYNTRCARATASRKKQYKTFSVAHDGSFREFSSGTFWLPSGGRLWLTTQQYLRLVVGTLFLFEEIYSQQPVLPSVAHALPPRITHRIFLFFCFSLRLHTNEENSFHSVRNANSWNSLKNIKAEL